MCFQRLLGAFSMSSGCSVLLKDTSAGHMIAVNGVWTEILKIEERPAHQVNLTDLHVVQR